MTLWTHLHTIIVALGTLLNNYYILLVILILVVVIKTIPDETSMYVARMYFC